MVISEASGGKSLTNRGVRRRHELMEAATTIFADRGYHATSVAEIVRNLGVGKGVFYWYFESKKALFGEILKEGLVGVRRAQAEAIAPLEDPVERIATGIEASLRYFAVHRSLFSLFEQAWSIEEFRPILRKGQQVLIGDTARHLSEAIQRGLARKTDPVFAAQAIFGVTTHVSRSLLAEDPPAAEIDKTIGEVVAFCMGGIRG